MDYPIIGNTNLKLSCSLHKVGDLMYVSCGLFSELTTNSNLVNRKIFVNIDAVSRCTVMI